MIGPDEIRPEIGKPDIYEMEKSPLLQKAAMFTEMLKSGNRNLQRFIDETHDFTKFNAEAVDEDKPYIQMEILHGVAEAVQHEFAPPDDMPLPPKGSSCWHSAGSEQ